MKSSAKLHRVADRYFSAMLIVPILALVAMMMTTVTDVFMRYVFNAPVTGSYDIVEICLMISVYYALPKVLFEGQPILIDLIDGIVPPPIVRLLKVTAAVLSLAALCFIFWSMVKPAQEAYMFGDMKLELDLPVWILWAIALFGVANGVLAAAGAIAAPQQQGHAPNEGEVAQ
ncbi:TRAP transporter small permease [Rhizobium sp. L1K21]|uniref:TRAP transporter small permease n=1 Tax=Rhizobium sp. L1K21 TaxID=2954933 RepID=UPI002091FBEA|nr:TRAP transporter small permease [Rhizobium sp. L1K21]MCO6188431.1 TRAP transporter small permease [Rhizobium sp. L1K21]